MAEYPKPKTVVLEFTSVEKLQAGIEEVENKSKNFDGTVDFKVIPNGIASYILVVKMTEF